MLVVARKYGELFLVHSIFSVTTSLVKKFPSKYAICDHCTTKASRDCVEQLDDKCGWFHHEEILLQEASHRRRCDEHQGCE